MDPKANIARQRELALEILVAIDSVGDEGLDAEQLANKSQELAELVHALDEWRTRGGFDPYEDPNVWPSYAQTDALRRLMAPRLSEIGGNARIARGNVAGLPPTYLSVVFHDGFECGIDTNGDVSS